ncbi:unnamed protein product [Clonostachys rosea f. rosea IK726]|uniref:Uncharacterized protein n=2 Tax=Bionectria ochroleuca TaxID=29856 RepID=A0A0B7K3H5_BIOOC|nr:unnamed protein product [Clonostachys rosea f. rosea IK726]
MSTRDSCKIPWNTPGKRPLQDPSLRHARSFREPESLTSVACSARQQNSIRTFQRIPARISVRRVTSARASVRSMEAWEELYHPETESQGTEE